MGKLRTITLTSEERKALESGYLTGKTHGFRQRCQAVLLKGEGLSSKETGKLVKLHPVTVNNWLSRYQTTGISGLNIQPGRGRKPVLDQEKDTEKVRLAVQQERQRLRQAKLLLEQELDKKFSIKTLKRFLKSLSAATKG